MKITTSIAIAALTLCAGIANAQQGISKNEIVIGTIQDLSGPLAGYGMPSHLRVTIGTEAENARFLEALAVALAG